MINFTEESWRNIYTSEQQAFSRFTSSDRDHNDLTKMYVKRGAASQKTLWRIHSEAPISTGSLDSLLQSEGVVETAALVK